MKSRAIVLHTTKYNDEAIIVHLLTEVSGCVSMLVRISRSKHAAVRHTLFQPLAVLDVEWMERPTANLQRPKQVQSALPFVSIPYDPHKSAIALFLSEFLTHAIKSGSEDPLLFQYILLSIQWLDACERAFANFHLVFLLRLTRFLGCLPNCEQADERAYFDLRASAFVPLRPLHDDFLEPAEASFIPNLIRMRYETMHVFHFSGADRSRLLQVITRYYRLHIANFPELKSLNVLKELF